MAKFHDDTEILAGDIISVKKAEFTAEEKKLYEEKCLKAIDILSEIYSWETPLNYREILLKEHHAEGIEYHIVMYADKLDAHMEVTHEILAGNDIFLEPLHRWNVDTHSFDHTKMKAKRLLKKLEEVFDIPLINTNKLFHIDQDVDIDTLNKQGSPFTSDCLGEKTGYILYDTWKDLHLQYWNTSEKEYLYTQKEFT